MGDESHLWNSLSGTETRTKGETINHGNLQKSPSNEFIIIQISACVRRDMITEGPQGGGTRILM